MYNSRTSTSSSCAADLFTEYFKKYKKRQPPPDLSDVVDFQNPKECEQITRTKLEASVQHPIEADYLGLLRSVEWKCCTIPSRSGFLYIENPFTPRGQEYWIRRCIKDFPGHNNITNMSPVMTGERENLPKTTPLLKSYSIADLKDLRWTTLGYHYDWTNKVYSDSRHTAIPKDLVALGRHIAMAIGYKNYQPEAVIVNNYHLDSTLAGHTDHSESDHRSPIISISFGQDAIFLLGGLTKHEKPIPMFLRSGDVIVMGDDARLSYHALPKVIQSPLAYNRWTDPNRSYCKKCNSPLVQCRMCNGNLIKRNVTLTHSIECEKTSTHCSRCNCDTTLAECIGMCIDCDTNEQRIDSTCSDEENLQWDKVIRDYIKKSRLNISIRQVYKYDYDSSMIKD